MCSTRQRLIRNNFNPRPPRGGRPRSTSRSGPLWEFQSTPPARGATSSNHYLIIRKEFQSTPPARGATGTKGNQIVITYISIHAPREGGDCVQGLTQHGSTISIHAPREGGDRRCFPGARCAERFQSTPPARGATAGSSPSPPPARYFNPRPPRGGRRNS